VTREIRTGERRAQIIHAALSCFIELGYAKTTMVHIRGRSEASTGSIYHHFKSKEQLAAAVYLEGIRNYQNGLLQVLEQEKRAREGIFAMVRYHLKWVTDNQDWARFLIQMRHAEFMKGTEETFRTLNQRFAQGICGWVIEQVTKKKIKRFQRDVFISLLLGPCQEYVRQWLGGHGVTDPSVAGEEIARALWQAVRYEG
jgi:AcrR family transcriptional regulator